MRREIDVVLREARTLEIHNLSRVPLLKAVGVLRYLVDIAVKLFNFTHSALHLSLG